MWEGEGGIEKRDKVNIGEKDLLDKLQKIQNGHKEVMHSKTIPLLIYMRTLRC